MELPRLRGPVLLRRVAPSPRHKTGFEEVGAIFFSSRGLLAIRFIVFPHLGHFFHIFFSVLLYFL